MISEKESKIIYILKAFAIISVVCAHISIVPDAFTKESIFVCTLLNEVGAIGVGVFFCVSGYLFALGKKDTFSYFFIKKLKTIGIPWLISASLVYLYVAIRKGGSLQGWLLSVIGYMSSFWYLTVLFMLYLIYFFVRKVKHDILLAIMLGIFSIISVLLRAVGIIEQDSLGVYLNVFNWSIFFSLGYLLSKVEKSKLLKLFDQKITIEMTIISSIIIILLPALEENKFSYFYFGYIPVEVIIIWSCIGWANIFSNKDCKKLQLVGKMSFAIYLYNELLWAGLIVNIGNRFDFWPLLFVRPVVVLAAVIFELFVGRWFFGLFNKKRLFDNLTGVRL